MKKIILSLAVIAMVAAVGTMATVSYFSDTDVSENNTFTAGNMEIYVNENGIYDNSTTGNGLPFNETNMSPGNSWGYNYAAVANKGSIPFNWEFTLNKTSDTPGTGDGNLYNVLKVKIEAVVNPDTTLKQYNYQTGFNCQNVAESNWTAIYGDEAHLKTDAGSTIDDHDGFIANGSYPDELGLIDPGKGVCFRFTTYLDGNLVNVNGADVDDNKFQNANVVYEMVADAYQTNDPDHLIP